jgi:hypothetical protein
MVSMSRAGTAQVWTRVCVKRQAPFREHQNAVLVGAGGSLEVAWSEKLKRRLDAERGRHKDDSHPCAHLHTLRCDVRTALYVPPPATATAASTSTSPRTRPPHGRVLTQSLMSPAAARGPRMRTRRCRCWCSTTAAACLARRS